MTGLTEQRCVQTPSIRFEDEFLAEYRNAMAEMMRVTGIFRH
jgi:hypothetical protein